MMTTPERGAELLVTVYLPGEHARALIDLIGSTQYRTVRAHARNEEEAWALFACLRRIADAITIADARR